MTVLNFGQISVISRIRYKIETYFQWETNRKSYVTYRMAPVLVTLNVIPRCRPFQVQSTEHFAVFYQISTDSALARSHSNSWASCYEEVGMSCCGLKHILQDVIDKICQFYVYKCVCVSH